MVSGLTKSYMDCLTGENKGLAICDGLAGIKCDKCDNMLVKGEIVEYGYACETVCQKCLGKKVLQYVW